MAYRHFGRLLTVKMLIRAGFMALSLGSIGVAHSEEAGSQRAGYHPPTQNYNQNNWMAGGGD